MNVSHLEWYGHWRTVLLASVLFVVFLVGFTWPRRGAEWRSAGMGSAFFIALFTEMFGVPLTLYLVAAGLKVSPLTFGLQESHLWAWLAARAGLVPLALGVRIVMGASIALIALGLSLLVAGWVFLFRGRGALVTRGLYRVVRHPQYVGLFLIIVGFVVQWPTVLTVIMMPILLVMYARLARREETALEARFGEEFRRYRDRVPGFFPAHCQGRRGRALAEASG